MSIIKIEINIIPFINFDLQVRQTRQSERNSHTGVRRIAVGHHISKYSFS